MLCISACDEVKHVVMLEVPRKEREKLFSVRSYVSLEIVRKLITSVKAATCIGSYARSNEPEPFIFIYISLLRTYIYIYRLMDR